VQQSQDEDHVLVCSTILKLLKDATPRPGGQAPRQLPTHLPSYNVDFLSSLFEDQNILRKYMCRSSLYHGTSIGQRSRGSSNDPLVQLSAKLHCHYGKPAEKPIVPAVASLGEPYDFACAKVYNLRHYTAESFWGPFKDDGSGEVDWEKVEASMVVMAVKTSRDKASLWTMPWREPFAGAYAQSYASPHPRKELEPLDPTDPYGISGTWMRVSLERVLLLFSYLFHYYPQHPSPSSSLVLFLLCRPWHSLHSHSTMNTCTTHRFTVAWTLTRFAPPRS
jgi:hypothetical protein